MKKSRRILFLCTGNSARSQMAEGWLRHLGGERFAVFSAGTHPVGVNPLAAAVMQEAGVDLTGHHSKYVEEFLGQKFDYVITVCDRAKEFCPVWLGAATFLHWSFEDPAAAAGSHEERQAMFRKIRDQIAGRIREFLAAES